jgi:PST family polysaccharide transporter
MRVDAVMLGQLSNDHTVGIYSAATRISEIWYFIPMAVTTAVLPVLVQLREKDTSAYHARLAQLFRGFALVSVCVSVIVTLTAGNLVSLLYGPAYQDAAPVLALHVWASIAVFMGVVSDRYLVIEQLQKLAFSKALVGMVSNVALNLLLIPAYGAVGAAVATLISYSLATFSLVLFPATRDHVRLMVYSLIPVRRMLVPGR